MARQFRLDFVPLVRERYDLLIWRRAFFEPPLQRRWAFCRSAPFAAKARVSAATTSAASAASTTTVLDRR